MQFKLAAEVLVKVVAVSEITSVGGDKRKKFGSFSFAGSENLGLVFVSILLVK